MLGEDSPRLMMIVAVTTVLMLAAGQFVDTGADGREIFVPAPRDAGETLDSSTRSSFGKARDRLTTFQGDRISGEVIDIESGGLLRLRSAQFREETRIKVSELDRVTFRPKKSPVEEHVLILTNGDRIACTVVSIGPESVAIESEAFGVAKVSRAVVKEVKFASRQNECIESDFEDGEMDPWALKQGAWTVSDGALVTLSDNTEHWVSAKLDQEEPMTMEVQYETIHGSCANLTLVMFSDDPDSSYGTNSVYCSMECGTLRLGSGRTRGNRNNFWGNGIGNPGMKGTLRMAYDPEDARMKVWLDGEQKADQVVPDRPTTGSYVTFMSRCHVKVNRLRVLKGFLSPSEDADKSAPKEDVLVLRNKDRLSIGSVAMQDDNIKAGTGYGDLDLPMARVDTIIFRGEGQEEPRRRTEDVKVVIRRSVFALRFEKLTETLFLGKADHLGEIKIPRDILKEIRFNIYRNEDEK